MREERKEKQGTEDEYSILKFLIFVINMIFKVALFCDECWSCCCNTKN